MLAIDIGNTNIKTGYFSDDELIENKLFDNEESFSSYLLTKPSEPIAISSVVPHLTEKIINILKNAGSSPPFILTKDVKFNLDILYDSPESLGIDRLCSAEGAFTIYKKSPDFNNYNDKTYILSIDLGTATTINIVRYPGEFTGGIIAPGIKMMFESLNSRTAQLPNADGDYFKEFFGRDTLSSIASGVINSATGLINNAIEYLKVEMRAEELKIFITGGNASKLLPYLKFEYKFIRELVLLGVKAVYNKNFKP